MKLGYMAEDQYGKVYKLTGTSASPREQLLRYLGASRAEKMYMDRGGESVHIGYIIEGLWLTVHEVHEWLGK